MAKLIKPLTTTKTDVENANNISDLVEKAASLWPDNVAMTSLGGNVSYQQVDQDSKAIASWLKSKHFEAGDRIAVALPNTLANPVAILGIIRAGLTAVCLNPLYTRDELSHALNDSGAKCLFAFAPLSDIAKKAMSKTSVEHVVIASPGEYLGFKSPFVNIAARFKFGKSESMAGAVKWSQAVKTTAQPLHTNTAADETAVIIYSGGTSGTPKGVPITHNNLLAGLSQQGEVLSGFMAGTAAHHYSVMLAVPLYHILGLGSFFYSLSQGGTAILVMNPSDLTSMIKEWERTPVVFFPAVNSLFNTLLESPRFQSLNLSSLSFCLGAGMAVSSETARRWQQVTGCEISEGYGLTETGLISVNPLTGNKLGSVGKTVSGVEIQLLDDNNDQVPQGGEGEVCVKGDAIMKHYLSNRDPDTHTDDGYFRTGDIGRFDDDGYLYIVDRKKDVIISSGFNVFPGEVERAINAIPGVYESAVIGKTNLKSGEVPVAYVVPRHNISKEDILSACKETLAGYKRPREIHFIDELPKSAVGKILRRRLAETAEQ